MSRVLISGHMGFIGSHTAERLVAEGHEVFGVDDGSSGDFRNIAGVKLAEHITGDIIEVADDVVRAVMPQAIIHLAAQPSLLASWESPYRDAAVNIFGTLSMLRAATANGVEKFVFASTSAVYYNDNRVPWVENHTRVGPDRPYGISKLAAEFYVRTLFPNSVVLRYGNVYGPRQVPVGENQIVPRVLSHIYNNQPFQVYGTGEQKRDFVYVQDVVTANITAMEYDKGGVFNISNNVGISINHILETLCKFTGFGSRFKHVEPKPNEPDEVVMDNSRAKTFLRWYPKTPIEDGLKSTVRWWEQNKCLS